MKILLILLLATTLSFERVTCCLKGWDVALAVQEDVLNKAYLASAFNQARLTLPTYVHDEKPNIQPGQTWGEQKSIKLSKITINKLSIRAMQGSENVGKLEVGFSSGSCIISKKIVLANGKDIGLKPRDTVFPFKHQIISFRVRVTSYKVGLASTRKDRYRILLEIVEEDAIIGELKWKDLSVFDSANIRQAITTLVRRLLAKGKRYGLGEFDLPKVNTRQTSLVKDLFPKQIRFVFIYAPNGKSVFAALTSTTPPSAKLPPNAFHWVPSDLLPTKFHSSITINSKKIFTVLKKAIAAKLGVSSNNLQVSTSCPNKLSLKNEVDNFQAVGLKLGRFSVTPYIVVDGEKMMGDQIEIKLKLTRNVSPGIDADIYLTLRFKLSYNEKKKKFDVIKTHQSHETVYRREGWVIFLEVISVGIGRAVTAIIENVATGIIDEKLGEAFNFAPSAGGLPINIGGPLKIVFDRLRVRHLFFDASGNLVVNFQIQLD